jgi:diguanylate cyclase (GGDEF)-like protein
MGGILLSRAPWVNCARATADNAAMGQPRTVPGSDAEARLRELAYRDHLTGLPNRFAMQERIAAALRRGAVAGGNTGLLFCDLDGIKLVNDTLGHAHGDTVLVDVAERLLSIGGPEVCAGRHGGDEFLLLIEDLPGDREAALALARKYGEQLADALSAPFSVGGAVFELTASAGVALAPWHAGDAISLIALADSAMHEAKRAGRARTVVFERAHQHSFAELEATRRVRRALHAGELELHYQPVIEVADGGGLGGLEALLRWRDPDRGLVLPGAFLPLIEHSPLLEELGEWVFEEVCRQLTDWRSRGFAPRISFNLPARQLRWPGFADSILRTAAAAEVDLTRVAIEITESAQIDLDPVLPVLRRLRDAGIVLSLDDFGTGYSSFARLRDMPFSLLKTDLSFMRGVPEDPLAVDLLQAMVTLGRTLGLVVIVEGVETQPQLERLLEIGVRVAQGYLFGRAVPPEEIEARYAARAV